MGQELPASHYDNIYSRQGSAYNTTPEGMRHYFPAWKSAYNHILKEGIKDVVDLGCGPGHFSRLFSRSDGILYKGYDFSEVSIDIARRENNNPNVSFDVKDLSDYTPPNDVFYTSFEFFEHVSFDTELVSKLPAHSHIIFSVPNFDNAGHCRYFESKTDVTDRYACLLDLRLMLETKFGSQVIYTYHGIRT